VFNIIIELAIIKYESSKKTIKTIVEISKAATELFKFLELEARV